MLYVTKKIASVCAEIKMHKQTHTAGQGYLSTAGSPEEMQRRRGRRASSIPMLPPHPDPRRRSCHHVQGPRYQRRLPVPRRRRSLHRRLPGLRRHIPRHRRILARTAAASRAASSPHLRPRRHGILAACRRRELGHPSRSREGGRAGRERPVREDEQGDRGRRGGRTGGDWRRHWEESCGRTDE